MTDETSALGPRAKFIGEQIQEARLAANKSSLECAQIIGVPGETFAQYESGEKMVSLPELEAIAYYLNTPIERFWEGGVIPAPDSDKKYGDIQRLMGLRNHMIGALLRQARLDSGHTLESLSQRTRIEDSRLEAYELGEQPVPLPELELLSGVLHRSIREFQDKHGPVGLWNIQQEALKDFHALPLELQLFISKPVNRPYLDLAVRLSEIQVTKLRAIAEGLLEITL